MERREFFLRGGSKYKGQPPPLGRREPGTDVEMPNGTTLGPYFVVDVRCGEVHRGHPALLLGALSDFSSRRGELVGGMG